MCLYWFSGCITSSTRLYYETLGPLATGEGRSLFVRKAEVLVYMRRFRLIIFKTKVPILSMRI